MTRSTSLSVDVKASPGGQQDLWGHPRGLYVLFLTEMWERFSFYGMRALLVFYLTKHFLFSDQISLGIYGSYVALGYATPVIGGLLADRYLGQRIAVTFGAVLMCLGHLGMAFEGAASSVVTAADGSRSIVHDEAGLQVFYISLALLIVGIGFLKPNIATIVNQLYPADDPRKSSGYTLFQMGIMLGAALSAGVCGYLGEKYGWGYGFGAAGVGMAIGLVVFLVGQKTLRGVAEPPPNANLNQRVCGPITRMHLFVLGAGLAVVVFWLLLQQTRLVGGLLALFSIIVIASVLYFSFFRCTPVERDRMLVILFLQLALTVFATLFEQAGGALNLFADRNVDRHLWGAEIKASQLQSLMPATIVVLAPFFAWLWPVLSLRGRNPRTPTKYVLTMVFMAAGFGLLAWASNSFAEAGRIHLGWLVTAYILFGVADLIIVSVSYTTITTLAPLRIVGMMMGTSMLAISAANFLAAQIASLAGPVRSAQAGVSIPPYETIAAYERLFCWLTVGAVVCAIVVALLTPLLTKRMHGVH